MAVGVPMGKKKSKWVCFFLWLFLGLFGGHKFYDGKIGTPSEVMVPFNDRVHFFGDGCYDATVGANGKVYL